MIKWVLQNNLGDRSGSIDKLIHFIEILGYEYESIKVVPFSDEPPETSNDTPTIFYGSTTLIKNVMNAKKWLPGVWFNEESYDFENLLKQYGKENLLNGDSSVQTIREFLDSAGDRDELFFLRPTSDFKQFAGTLMTKGEANFQWKDLDQSNGDLHFSTKIQVAIPKTISAEYRTIVLNQKVITASSYKINNRFCQTADIPGKVIDYANEMAKLYSPEEVFTLDVCELPNGKLKIVELNTFNCSGFYYCDFYKIVKKVSEFVMEKYK